MNWLSNITPPGIKNLLKRQNETPDSLWVKCGNCGEMVFNRDLEASHQVCPSCDHHMRLSVDERFAMVFDDGVYDKVELPEPVIDPLKFKDEKKYADRLKDYRKKSGAADAIEVATGKIEGAPVVVAVQNFAFMGGSMGMALGDAMIKAVDEAISRRAGFVVFSASGGARMQEGILSLMQMPRTTVAVQMLKEAGLPYIVVLTHPTTGGVTASFAMLGDVHFAEPGALIGFAGPRVIEQTIREKLPEGFQRSEFLQDKGMVDQVVHRRDMRAALGRFLRVVMRIDAEASIPIAAAPPPDGAKANDAVDPSEPVHLDKAAE